MTNNNLLTLHELYNKKLGKMLNQREFAELLEISPSKLSVLEAGKRAPSINEAFAYRRLTGASLDYIYGFSDSPVLAWAEVKTGAMLDIAGSRKNKGAMNAVNHLIGNYDSLAFFTLLDALWQTKPQNRLDMGITIEEASEMAACLIQAKTPSEAFPIRCKIERLLLEYIQSHRYEKPHEDNPDSEMDDILMDDLI